MTLKAEKFEELLTQELSSALEPQRGKSLAAFRAHLAAEAERPVVAGSLKHQAASGDISRKEFWFWSSVPSLAAACLAVMVTLKMTHTTAPIVNPANNGTSANSGGLLVLVPHVEQTDEITQHKDGQLVREEVNHTTQWQENGTSFRLSQPQPENVKYEQVVPF